MPQRNNTVGMLVIVATISVGALLWYITNQLPPLPEPFNEATYVIGAFIFLVIMLIAFAVYQEQQGQEPNRTIQQSQSLYASGDSNRRKFLTFLGLSSIGVVSVILSRVVDAWISTWNNESPSLSEGPEPQLPDTLGGAAPDRDIKSDDIPVREPIAEAELTPPEDISELTKDSFSFDLTKIDQQGRIANKESKSTSLWIEHLSEDIQLGMIYIPDGTFIQGANRNEEGSQENNQMPEGPQREVSIQAFLMSQHPITQSVWRFVSRLPRIETELRPDISAFLGDRRPVERITWFEAIEFCNRLSKATGRNYRLPKESEWEYACRAGTTTPFYFGETISTELANYDGNYSYGQGSKGVYRGETTDVGTFPPNAYGLFDMHGNVWEWCIDNWISEMTDDARIIRGGSWFNSPQRCRSANRTFLKPDGGRDNDDKASVGFRIVCAAESIR